MIFFIWQLQAAQALSRVQKWGGKGTDKVKPLLQ
jgi:MATE family multidrug resistance protein